MKATQARLALVTCGSRSEAQRIARQLVEHRLAACVNICSQPVQSVYRWNEKVETAKEFLLLIKSTQKLLPKLQREVQRLHSYDVPEFIILPIVSGSVAYLAWLAESVARHEDAN